MSVKKQNQFKLLHKLLIKGAPAGKHTHQLLHANFYLGIETVYNHTDIKQNANYNNHYAKVSQMLSQQELLYSILLIFSLLNLWIHSKTAIFSLTPT